jgi:predicted nuclease with TOPRIM domain
VTEEELNERIDHVARELQRIQLDLKDRFAWIDERFSQIDERFSQIDERFSQIDERFSQIDRRFGQLEQKILRRFDEVALGMAQGFAQINERLDHLAR